MAKSDWKTGQFFRMWPRALFHMTEGMGALKSCLSAPGVYILYREDAPYYIGKTGRPLLKRLTQLAQQHPRYGCKRLYVIYERVAGEGDPYMNYKRFRRLYRLANLQIYGGADGPERSTFAERHCTELSDRTISGRWILFRIGCFTVGCFVR